MNLNTHRVYINKQELTSISGGMGQNRKINTNRFIMTRHAVMESRV